VFDTLTIKAIEPIRWLIILGLAYTLANTAAVFFTTPQATPLVTAQTTESRQARPTANANWILTKHLFGEAGAQPENRNDGKPPVHTRLPLELKAVWLANESDASKAIVAQKGKPAQRYGIGDTLPGNATLVEVLADRITFRRAGVLETLIFTQWKLQFTATQNTVPAPPRAESRQQRREQDEGAYEEESSHRAASAAEIAVELLRERLSIDGEEALADLANISDSPYLRQTGLLAGDVILTVNGKSVGDVQQDQLQIENILAQGTARIEIKRGERRFIITASLSQ
jgi:general secretion pathway protein C